MSFTINILDPSNNITQIVHVPDREDHPCEPIAQKTAKAVYYATVFLFGYRILPAIINPGFPLTDRLVLGVFYSLYLIPLWLPLLDKIERKRAEMARRFQREAMLANRQPAITSENNPPQLIFNRKRKLQIIENTSIIVNRF
jgi:quinol-cytochrome oxidoreductase complex cytochrome b subunit